MGIRACTSVQAGTPISQSEWKDPRQAEVYREYWGQPRCVCKRQGDAPLNNVTMTELCEWAGLVHKVGNTIFGGRSMSKKRGQYSEMDALDASLDEFAALIETYNLKAVGIGAGVGGVTGIAIPGIMRMLPAGNTWDWVRMLSPAVVTGIIAALVAKKQPVVAVALVAGGSTLSLATIANKFMFKDVGGVGVSLSPGAESLIASAQATVAAANQRAAVAGFNDTVDDYQLVQGGGNGDGQEDLPFGDTDLLLDGLGRMEPLYANEDQSNGLEGMSLVDENTFSQDLSFMV